MSPPISKKIPSISAENAPGAAVSLEPTPAPANETSLDEEAILASWNRLIQGGSPRPESTPTGSTRNPATMPLPLHFYAAVLFLHRLMETFPNYLAQIAANGPHSDSPETIPAEDLARGIAQLWNLMNIEEDPDLDRAEEIREWFAEKPEYRTGVPHSQWEYRPEQAWSIRPRAVCLLELGAMGVPYRRIPLERVRVSTPVEITGPVDSVNFEKRGAGGRLLVSCEMATRLPYLARTFRDRGIKRVQIISALRKHPHASFHTLGMGLDITKLWHGETQLSVLRNYEPDWDQATCPGNPAMSGWGELMRDLACEWSGSGVFSTVLTPNYRRGHHNHYHLDIRPEDPIFFTR